MQQSNFLQNRFTIQQFKIPFPNPNPRLRNTHTVTNYHSQKKIISNPQHLTIRRINRERKSEQLERVHKYELQKIGSLPDIKCNSKTLDVWRVELEERIPSFSSKKLNVNAYRKIEKAINFKYCKKMESLANNVLKNKKLFSINNLKNDLPAHKQPIERNIRQFQQKGVHQKGIHFAIIQKHHIDRIKDQYQIPLELHTQRCHEQQVDNHQLNLQIKHLMRFQFDNQMHSIRGKQKLQKKEEKVMKIDPWELDHSRFRPSLFYS